MTTRIVRENLIVRVGVTFAHVFTWTTAAGGAVDLTGYSAALKIVDAGGATVHTATPTLGGAAGTVTVSIAAATTAGFTEGHGNTYSLVLTSSGGAKTELARGHVSIESVVL